MVKRAFRESKSSQKWLNFAKHDLDLAFLINRDSGFTDTVCYFCHQTVEKALKALLIANGVIDFPHIHNLKILFKQAINFYPQLEEFESSVKELNKYYIETKYPADMPVNYPAEEAERATESATKIYEFVEKKI
ncbi:HEPN domain-containing protein [Candidatus Gottesmanbacteria bacterium]|nr:HEPN domain-containing protein [Candidatus Gottesmanbacteria bacterium]